MQLLTKTAEETMEEAILAIQKAMKSYSSMKMQGFGFQASLNQDETRIQRLNADYDEHFKDYIQKGQLVRFDKNYSFCESYKGTQGQEELSTL